MDIPLDLSTKDPHPVDRREGPPPDGTDHHQDTTDVGAAASVARTTHAPTSSSSDSEDTRRTETRQRRSLFFRSSDFRPDRPPCVDPEYPKDQLPFHVLFKIHNAVAQEEGGGDVGWNGSRKSSPSEENVTSHENWGVGGTWSLKPSPFKTISSDDSHDNGSEAGSRGSSTFETSTNVNSREVRGGYVGGTGRRESSPFETPTSVNSQENGNVGGSRGSSPPKTRADQNTPSEWDQENYPTTDVSPAKSARLDVGCGWSARGSQERSPLKVRTDNDNTIGSIWDKENRTPNASPTKNSPQKKRADRSVLSPAKNSSVLSPVLGHVKSEYSPRKTVADSKHGWPWGKENHPTGSSPARKNQGDKVYQASYEHDENVIKTPSKNEARTPRKESRTPLRDTSKTPLRDTSKTPLRDTSKTPLRDTSKTPLRETSKTPLRETSKTPLRDTSKTPLRERSKTPLRDISNTHLKTLTTNTPVKESGNGVTRVKNSVRTPLKLLKDGWAGAELARLISPVKDDTEASHLKGSMVNHSTPLIDRHSDRTLLKDRHNRTPLRDRSSHSTPLRDRSSHGTPQKDRSSHRTPLKDISSNHTPVRDRSSHRSPMKDRSSQRTPVKDATSHLTPLKDSTSTTPLKTLRSHSHSTPPKDSLVTTSPKKSCEVTPLKDLTRTPAKVKVKERICRTTPLKKRIVVTTSPLRDLTITKTTPLKDSTNVTTKGQLSEQGVGVGVSDHRPPPTSKTTLQHNIVNLLQLDRPKKPPPPSTPSSSSVPHAPQSSSSYHPYPHSNYPHQSPFVNSQHQSQSHHTYYTHPSSAPSSSSSSSAHISSSSAFLSSQSSQAHPPPPSSSSSPFYPSLPLPPFPIHPPPFASSSLCPPSSSNSSPAMVSSSSSSFCYPNLSPSKSLLPPQRSTSASALFSGEKQRLFHEEGSGAQPQQRSSSVSSETNIESHGQTTFGGQPYWTHDATAKLSMLPYDNATTTTNPTNTVPASLRQFDPSVSMRPFDNAVPLTMRPAVPASMRHQYQRTFPVPAHHHPQHGSAVPAALYETESHRLPMPNYNGSRLTPAVPHRYDDSVPRSFSGNRYDDNDSSAHLDSVRRHDNSGPRSSLGSRYDGSAHPDSVRRHGGDVFSGMSRLQHHEETSMSMLGHGVDSVSGPSVRNYDGSMPSVRRYDTATRAPVHRYGEPQSSDSALCRDDVPRPTSPLTVFDRRSSTHSQRTPDHPFNGGAPSASNGTFNNYESINSQQQQQPQQLHPAWSSQTFPSYHIPSTTPSTPHHASPTPSPSLVNRQELPPSSSSPDYRPIGHVPTGQDGGASSRVMDVPWNHPEILPGELFSGSASTLCAQDLRACVLDLRRQTTLPSGQESSSSHSHRPAASQPVASRSSSASFGAVADSTTESSLGVLAAGSSSGRSLGATASSGWSPAVANPHRYSPGVANTPGYTPAGRSAINTEEYSGRGGATLKRRHFSPPRSLSESATDPARPPSPKRPAMDVGSSYYDSNRWPSHPVSHPRQFLTPSSSFAAGLPPSDGFAPSDADAMVTATALAAALVSATAPGAGVGDAGKGKGKRPKNGGGKCVPVKSEPSTGDQPMPAEDAAYRPVKTEHHSIPGEHPGQPAAQADSFGQQQTPRQVSGQQAKQDQESEGASMKVSTTQALAAMNDLCLRGNQKPAPNKPRKKPLVIGAHIHTLLLRLVEDQGSNATVKLINDGYAVRDPFWQDPVTPHTVFPQAPGSKQYCWIDPKGQTLVKADKREACRAMRRTWGKYLCIFCTKRFADATDMVRHSRTHTGSLPFACADCNTSYSQLVTLEGHRFKKHQVAKPAKGDKRPKSHLCEFCSHLFTQQEDYVTHLRENHPDHSHLGRLSDRRLFHK